MTNTRSWTRLDGVDLLRGLAILLVLLNHVNMRLFGAKIPYLRDLPAQLATSIAWNGQYGVQIFFAVSGFLITATTLRRWKAPADVSLRDFYLLRFARIGPLLLLLLAVLSTLHFVQIEGFIVSAKTGGLGRALLAALTFHVNLLEARRGYLPASWDILWSLSVEEMFYLGFPLACRLFRRTSFLIIPLVFFVMFGPLARSRAFNHNPVWREYSYLGGMDAIALGCLTAILLARKPLPRATIWTLGVAGTGLLTFSLAFSLQAYAWKLGRNGLDMTILAVGTCMLITVSAQTRWEAPRILTPLRLVGQRSYEIYLTHVFIVLGLFHIFLVTGRSMRAVPALFIVVILAAGLLGELVARFYSEPMNRWLRGRFGNGPGRLGSVISEKTASS